MNKKIIAIYCLIISAICYFVSDNVPVIVAWLLAD